MSTEPISGISDRGELPAPAHHAGFNRALQKAVDEAAGKQQAGWFRLEFEVNVTANPGSVGEYRIKLTRGPG